MRRSFTLVELMVVVAIGMVLAAIAIPVFHEAQMKARFVEVEVNSDGIWTAIEAYAADNGPWGSSIISSENPNLINPLDKVADPWSPAGLQWGTLAFEPDGDLRCHYRWFYWQAGMFGHPSMRELDISCNLDGGGQEVNIYMHATDGDPFVNQARITPAGTNCTPASIHACFLQGHY